MPHNYKTGPGIPLRPSLSELQTTGIVTSIIIMIIIINMVIFAQTICVSAGPVLKAQSYDVANSKNVKKQQGDLVVTPRVVYVRSGDNLTLVCCIPDSSGGRSHSSITGSNSISSISSVNDNNNISSSGNDNNNNNMSKSDALQENVIWKLPNGQVALPDITNKTYLDPNSKETKQKKKIDNDLKKPDQRVSVADAPVKRRHREELTIAEVKVPDSGSYVCKNERGNFLAIYDVIVVAPPPSPYQCHLVQKQEEPNQSRDPIIVCSTVYFDSAHFKYTLVALVPSKTGSGANKSKTSHLTLAEGRQPRFPLRLDALPPTIMTSSSATSSSSAATSGRNKDGDGDHGGTGFARLSVCAVHNVLASVQTCSPEIRVNTASLLGRNLDGNQNKDGDELSGALVPALSALAGVAALTAIIVVVLVVLWRRRRERELGDCNKDNDERASISPLDPSPHALTGEINLAGPSAELLEENIGQDLTYKASDIKYSLKVTADQTHSKELKSSDVNYKFKDVTHKPLDKEHTFSDVKHKASGVIHKNLDTEQNDIGNNKSDRRGRTEKAAAYVEMTYNKVESLPQKDSNLFQDDSRGSKKYTTGTTSIKQKNNINFVTSKDYCRMNRNPNSHAETDRPDKRRARAYGDDLGPGITRETYQHAPEEQESLSPHTLQYNTHRPRLPSCELRTTILHEYSPTLDLSTERCHFKWRTSADEFASLKSSGVAMEIYNKKSDKPFRVKTSSANIAGENSPLVRKNRWSLAQHDFAGIFRDNGSTRARYKKPGSQRSFSASTVDDEDWLSKWAWLESSPDVTCTDQHPLLVRSSTPIPFIDDILPTHPNDPKNVRATSTFIEETREHPDTGYRHEATSQLKPAEPVKYTRENVRNDHMQRMGKTANGPPSRKGDYYKFPSSKPISETDRARIKISQEKVEVHKERDEGNHTYKTNAVASSDTMRPDNKQHIWKKNGPYNDDDRRNRNKDMHSDEKGFARVQAHENVEIRKRERTSGRDKPYSRVAMHYTHQPPHFPNFHVCPKHFRRNQPDLSGSTCSLQFVHQLSETSEPFYSSFTDLRRLESATSDDVVGSPSTDILSVVPPDLDVPPKLRKKTKCQSEFVKTLNSPKKQEIEEPSYDYPKRLAEDKVLKISKGSASQVQTSNLKDEHKSRTISKSSSSQDKYSHKLSRHDGSDHLAFRTHTQSSFNDSHTTRKILDGQRVKFSDDINQKLYEKQTMPDNIKKSKMQEEPSKSSHKNKPLKKSEPSHKSFKGYHLDTVTSSNVVHDIEETPVKDETAPAHSSLLDRYPKQGKTVSTQPHSKHRGNAGSKTEAMEPTYRRYRLSSTQSDDFETLPEVFGEDTDTQNVSRINYSQPKQKDVFNVEPGCFSDTHKQSKHRSSVENPNTTKRDKTTADTFTDTATFSEIVPSSTGENLNLNNSQPNSNPSTSPFGSIRHIPRNLSRHYSIPLFHTPSTSSTRSGDKRYDMFRRYWKKGELLRPRVAGDFCLGYLPDQQNPPYECFSSGVEPAPSISGSCKAIASGSLQNGLDSESPPEKKQSSEEDSSKSTSKSPLDQDGGPDQRKASCPFQTHERSNTSLNLENFPLTSADESSKPRKVIRLKLNSNSYVSEV